MSVATFIRAVALAFVFAPLAGSDARQSSPWPEWNDGSRCEGRPAVESFWLDADLAVLRESLCFTAEAPFLYLLIGERDAMLIDSGDGTPGLAVMVRSLLEAHESRSGRRIGRLFVTHTHAHADHVRGDTALSLLPGAVVVGHSPEELSTTFRISSWPDGVGRIDLGRRQVDILPIPGHERSHVAYYDRRSRYLFTGDSLYPGRIYVEPGQMGVFDRSVRRLADFARARRPAALLGAHVEMSTTPGRDFPIRSRVHPRELSLPLKVRDLLDLRDTVSSVAAAPREVRHDRFILVPLR